MSDDPVATRRRLSPTNAGVLWGAATQGSGQIVRLAVLFVLARQLTPRDFGLVAACMVITETASRIAALGLLPAITARKTVTDHELSTLFWTSAGIGAALWGIVWLASDVFAAFVEDPASAGILRQLAFVFLPAGSSAIPMAILTRRLDFRSLALGDLFCMVGGGLLAIAMALAGAGVEALVVYTVAPAVLRLVWSLARARWRPRLHFSPAELRDFLAFGSASLGSQLAGIIGSRLDLLLIARAVGTASAGYYSFAIRIIDGPRLRVAGVFGRVLFAVAAREQDDPQAFRRTAMRLLKQQSLVLWPALVGLSAVAEDAIRTAAGEDWLAAAAPLQVICATALVRSLSSFCATVQTAAGNPRRPLLTGLFGIVAMPPVVTLCAPHGLVVVALGIGALSLATLVLSLAWLPRTFVGPRDMLQPLVTPALANVAMLAALLGLDATSWVEPWPALARLAAAVVVGGAVYVGVAGWIDREALVGALRRIRS